MPLVRLDIETFLSQCGEYPVIDVRSPAEYLHAHIPGAYSLPLFDDDERAQIGTAYNRQGRAVAVTIGLDFFSKSMKGIQPAALKYFSEKNIAGDPVFFVYCWRGGMRSGAVAWLLSLYGYRVYVLDKGYKSFRRWALDRFGENYRFNILGGFTGSGKTDVLKELKSMDKKVIDLEAIACHKGSAFGSLGMPEQPSQEMFENLLAMSLSTAKQQATNESIWVEDESRHIGKSFIPEALWKTLRKSPFYFLDIPQQKRLDYIVGQYGQFDNEQLKASVLKISKRLGGAETKNALGFLDRHRTKDAFRILLEYYDKMYRQSLDIRFHEGIELHKISSLDVNSKNAFLL